MFNNKKSKEVGNKLVQQLMRKFSDDTSSCCGAYLGLSIKSCDYHICNECGCRCDRVEKMKSFIDDKLWCKPLIPGYGTLINYNKVAREMFPIQPLGKGALPIYDIITKPLKVKYIGVDMGIDYEEDDKG